jgi:hypothetical protein
MSDAMSDSDLRQALLGTWRLVTFEFDDAGWYMALKSHNDDHAGVR